MRKKDKNKVTEEESAITVAAPEDEETEHIEFSERKQKQSLIKTITGAVDTARNVGNMAAEIYNAWIKPIRENWPQIKRRMSLITTLISIVFFLLYVPFLLVSKIGKDLALGYDVALYVCMGIYLVTLAALVIVTVASGNSTSVAKNKMRKKASSIILMIVRLASLAIGITALIISAVEGSSDSHSAVVDTIAIIFAVMSILFSAFPLLFGGLGGFVKWLISPAKIKLRFSFVILEWLQSYIDEQQIDKNIKKISKRYGERISACVDKYFLPALGDKYIKTVDYHAVEKFFEGVPEEDVNICEWIMKNVFEYALDCKYVDVNPCEKLDLQGDLAKEGKVKKNAEPSAAKGGFFSLFRRRSSDESALADDDE